MGYFRSIRAQLGFSQRNTASRITPGDDLEMEKLLFLRRAAFLLPRTRFQFDEVSAIRNVPLRGCRMLIVAAVVPSRKDVRIWSQSQIPQCADCPSFSAAISAVNDFFPGRIFWIFNSYS